jgi:hypothetical protein
VSNLVGTADVSALWPEFAALGTTTQNALIGAASGWVESYCRRTFEVGTVTDTLDGTGLPRLWLSRRPVIAIGTVTVNGATLDNTSGDAYTANRNTGALVRGNGQGNPRFASTWPTGFQNIGVVYTAGFALIPEPVKTATVSMCKHLNDAVPNTGIFSSENLGGYSYVINTAFAKGGPPPAIASLLAPYVQDDIA